jgi:Zn-dependent M28 family amino/carboxypeptidase
MKGRFWKYLSVSTLSTLIFLLLMVFSHAIADVQSTRDLNSVRQTAMMNVDASRLRDTVQHLENFGNRSTWEKQWDVARWLEQKLKEYGLDVAVQSYEFRGRQWPNVIAQIKGHAKANDIILLIAHFDSTSDNQKGIAPGADDNGSGVSVLIETARNFKEASLEKTVMFCLLSNEEPGNAGSKAFAGNAKRHKLNIYAVINLDILGYNAPEQVSLSDAVQSHHTFKHKLKSLYRIVKNRLFYFLKGKNQVIVAGQQKDSSLVKAISNNLQVHAGLRSKEITDDACV